MEKTKRTFEIDYATRSVGFSCLKDSDVSGANGNRGASTAQHVVEIVDADGWLRDIIQRSEKISDVIYGGVKSTVTLPLPEELEVSYTNALSEIEEAKKATRNPSASLANLASFAEPIDPVENLEASFRSLLRVAIRIMEHYQGDPSVFGEDLEFFEERRKNLKPRFKAAKQTAGYVWPPSRHPPRWRPDGNANN